MESPVVLDKPPEYHSKGTQNNDKGFPFEEEEEAEGAGGAWGSLAARHPDIAARLRARPSAWGRKRRSSHSGTGAGAGGGSGQPTAHAQPDDDFAGGLGEHFDRFPFDDIPPEFREHFPGHWGQRFAPQEREPPAAHPAPPRTHPPPPQNKPYQNTISTQTEEDPTSTPTDTGDQNPEPSGSLPQYGLRNTVDLGQKTPADPSFVDAEEERNQRSMSAPPDNRVPTPSQPSMGNSTGGPAQPPPPDHHHHHDHGTSNVRHIPIFVEGRDEPIVNRAHPEAPAHAEPKQQYAPPPPPPSDRDYYEPGMGFHHPPNFSRAFGTPFGKGYRQGPQPFAPQRASQPGPAPPARSQSPKPQPPQQPYTQIPVHHQHAPQPPPPQQQRQPSPQPPPPPPQQQQQRESPPPPQPAPPTNDPITKILSIQKDVLDLMTEVENFVGTKADKRYIYLDEMLTRNLIKLDDIETEGKENIRLARKEAIKCIQKCIAVLEAKADGKIPTTPQPADVEAKSERNGRAEGDAQPDQSETPSVPADQPPPKESGKEGDAAEEVTEPATEEAKAAPKKTKKVVKKRDKSKDKETSDNDNTKNDVIKNEENQAKDVEMQANQNSDSSQVDPPPMETEGAAVSSQ